MNIVGIDLGNSYARVSVFEGSEAILIGEIPSVISFTDNECLIGKLAKVQSVANPENTIYSVKSLIEKEWSDVSKEAISFPYKLVKNSQYTFCVEIGEKLYSSHALVALFFLYLKNMAEKYLGTSIFSIILTIPTYFSHRSIAFMKEAAEIAGLEICRIINDSVATALTLPCIEEKQIAVIDIGSSGMSVSILELDAGVYEVLSNSGSIAVSGDNINQLIISWFLNEFRKDEGIELQLKPEIIHRLKEAVEKAKIELSDSISADIDLPYIMQTNGVYKHFKKQITRETFEKLISPLIESAVSIYNASLKECGVDYRKRLEELIITGGTCSILAIRKSLENHSCAIQCRKLGVERSVMGAAVLGAILTDKLKHLVLLDVFPLTIGIEVHGGVTFKMLEKNGTIPARKSAMFSTSGDNRTDVSVHIVEGDAFMAFKNNSLGVYHFSSIESLKNIEIDVDIDARKDIVIRVKDKLKGNEQIFNIQYPSMIDKSELLALKSGIQNYLRVKDLRLLSKKIDGVRKLDIESDSKMVLDNLPILDE